MKDTYEQHLKQVEKLENRLLNQQENTFIQSTISPVVQKIQDIIPAKLKSTLNIAFFKGFQLIFEKGTTYIEKTYNKDKIDTDYKVNDYAVDLKANKRHMNRLDKQAKQATMLNTSISVVEGSILGILGVGLPDIPLFLSVVMKTIYEVALSYGFGYETEEEKAYTLLLICGAISKGDKQKSFDNELTKLGEQIDRNIEASIKLEEQMKLTSEVISDALLTAKFIQGIPIVGAIGGVVNYSIINRISSYARLKYKKRYLLKKRDQQK